MGEPRLSIGWDWLAESSYLVMVTGSVRTNLMLTDEQGQDLGQAATVTEVERWLKRWGWQRPVLSVVAAR